MTGARDAVLGAVARAVRGRDRKAAAQARIRAHPAGPLPARARCAGEAAAARFIEEAEKVSAKVARLESAADIPAFTARYLAGHNLPGRVRVSDDPVLAGAGWEAGAPALEILRGPAAPEDTAAVSAAFAGAAETGTLVLRADARNPGALASLPPHHIAVLPADRIMGSYEETWDMLRREPHPRAAVWVTGPSRTGDIEQTLLMGAHGPRHLQILILGRADGA